MAEAARSGDAAPISMPGRRDLMELRRVPGAGRGVFATAAVARGTLLERAPCIRFDAASYRAHVAHTCLEFYVFSLRGGGVLLALGWGSLFNHSPTPNLDYKLHAGPSAAAAAAAAGPRRRKPTGRGGGAAAGGGEGGESSGGDEGGGGGEGGGGVEGGGAEQQQQQQQQDEEAPPAAAAAGAGKNDAEGGPDGCASSGPYEGNPYRPTAALADGGGYGEDCWIDFSAARDIAAGEQLCFYYGSRPEWDGPEFGPPSSDDEGFLFGVGDG